MDNVWTKKDKPIFVLAPMAGYTDAAFRLLCREFGADIVVSELVSADAIAYGKFKLQKAKVKIKEEELLYNKVVTSKNNTTAEMLSFFENERPFVVQLFGKYPEKFALAAKWVSENLKPDGIDINMGCPARKVVGSDHGAALLKKPDLAVEIIQAVKANTNLPVSVKTRLGWENDDEILEFAPKLVEAGIDAITIHGRTYKNGFSGKARWENIYRVKEMIGEKAVVIGNGDVDRFSMVDDRLSNLDGVAIGRAAFGKPWIFENQISGEGDNIADVEKRRLSGVISRHSELAYAAKGEKGIIEFRKHLLCYLKGFPNAKELRLEAVNVTTLADIDRLLEKL